MLPYLLNAKKTNLISVKAKNEKKNNKKNILTLNEKQFKLLTVCTRLPAALSIISSWNNSCIFFLEKISYSLIAKSNVLM